MRGPWGSSCSQPIPATGRPTTACARSTSCVPSATCRSSWPGNAWNDPRLRACVSDYQEFLDLFEPVARDFPSVRFLLTHWGCFTWGDNWLANCRAPFPLLAPFVRLLNSHENLFTDIAAITIFFGDDMAWNKCRLKGPEWEYPYANGLDLLEGLVKGAGAERVMWGTDWPWTDGRCTYKQNLTMVTSHADFLSDEESGSSSAPTRQSSPGCQATELDRRAEPRAAVDKASLRGESRPGPARSRPALGTRAQAKRSTAWTRPARRDRTAGELRPGPALEGPGHAPATTVRVSRPS